MYKDFVEIGMIIKLALMKKGMTQKEFGKKYHAGESAVSSWLRGTHLPPANKLIQIIRDFDLVSEIYPGYVKEYTQDKIKTKIENLEKEVKRLKAALEVQDGLKQENYKPVAYNHTLSNKISPLKD